MEKPLITTHIRLISSACCLAAWIAVPATAAETPAFEEIPQAIDVTLVVPEERRSGPGFTVNKVAVNNGAQTAYTVTSDWGERQVVGDYQLMRVIQEIRALQTLDEMSRSGVFGDAFKGGVMSAVEGTKMLVKEPVETTKNAFRGIGRWAGNIRRGITSKDPYQEGGFSSAVGWAGTKRAFALELGVDPYTDWEPIQDALTEVGRAAFAGGISAGFASDAVAGDGTTGTVVSVTSLTADMNQILIDNPPELLTEMNTELLEEAGVPSSTVRPFMRNYNYTPMEKTLLVANILGMEKAAGKDVFIGEAATALASEKVEVWLEGSTSPTAREALTAAGWTVKERVGLLTGEPLQDKTSAGAGMGAASKAMSIAR